MLSSNFAQLYVEYCFRGYFSGVQRSITGYVTKYAGNTETRSHRVIFPSPVQRSRELRVSPAIFPTGNNGTLRLRVSAFKKTL